MRRAMSLSAVALLLCCALGACGRAEKEASKPPPEPLDEHTAAVARSRGVATGQNESAEPPSPQVLLSELTYEWRTAPERGLMVTLDFTNPADTYERARGYVFLVAESSATGRTGVYPWNTRMVEGLPEDYTEGTHLLYRATQQVRGFIPYEGSSGMYDRLRLFVFHEDGRLLTNRTYTLELTGESGESRTINPGFDL